MIFFKKLVIEESLAKILIMDHLNLLNAKDTMEALMFLDPSLSKETWMMARK